MSIAKKTSGMDMLHGKLLSKLLLFALPIAISSILQQLFNSVDVAVVGKFASSQEQAAVGCNAPVINLMINLFVGISIGANVAIANYVGQQNREKIKDTVHTSMLVAVISGLFLLVLGQLVARPILHYMDTPEDILNYAVTYLKIYFLGMPFIMVYNFGAAILRSIGDTRRPLYCLVLSGIINALLNLFLVVVFHLGASGVAIATVVANMISSSIVVYILTHETGEIRLSLKKLKIVKKELNYILRIGVPAGVQGMVFSFANVFIQTALNGFGSDVVAGSAVALNYEFFSYFVIAAFNQTAVTFISQNFGAQQYDRCKKIFWLCMGVGTLIMTSMSLTFVLGRSFFAYLFTTSPVVAEYAMIRMVYVLTLNFLISTYEIGGAALRGIGYSTLPAVITIFGTCVLRIVWLYTVCKWFPTYETLMVIYPISWVITGVPVLISYFVISKKVFSQKVIKTA